MKQQKDTAYLIAVAFFVAILAMVAANFIFKSSNNSTSVPIVQPIKATLPDIKNDPTYNSFLNTKALDPAEPVQVGNNQNTQPFNGQ